MALLGALEDIPVADVVQFVHLSGKSGTLTLTAPAGSAHVEFADGQIVFARSSATASLGELVVAEGLVRAEELAPVLQRQRALDPAPPLGRLLVEARLLTREQLVESVRTQVQHVLGEVSGWRKGEFVFTQSAGITGDPLRFDVSEVLGDVRLNTEQVLLEALRLMDEGRRDEEEGVVAGLAPAPAPSVPEPLAPLAGVRPAPMTWAAAPDIRAEPTFAPGGPRPRPGMPESGVILVGCEKQARLACEEVLGERGYRVLGHVPLGDVREQLLSNRAWPAGVLVLWRLRARRGEEAEGQFTLLEELLGKRPRWPVAALVAGPTDLLTRAYATGVRAALPWSGGEEARGPFAEALGRIVSDVWRDNAVEAGLRAAELRAWVQATRLTRELHRAMQGASITLELMRVASGMLERAVLFLAKEQELIGLGAFGLTSGGRPMAECLKGLALPVRADTAVHRALTEGIACLGAPEQLGLDPVFFELAGRPRTGRAALIPLVGPTRTIGLLYGDNAGLAEPLKGVRTIELAAAQAGMAYETALLRKLLEERARPRREAS